MCRKAAGFVLRPLPCKGLITARVVEQGRLAPVRLAGTASRSLFLAITILSVGVRGVTNPDTPDVQNSPVSATEKRFHGWRLLGVLALIILATAGVSALVDLWVIPR